MMLSMDRVSCSKRQSPVLPCLFNGLEEKQMSVNECRKKAYLFYVPSYNGKCKPGWVLHHCDITLKYEDPIRYKEWRITDLVPMTVKEHTLLHNTYKDWSFAGKHHSDESKELMRIAALNRAPISEETREKLILTRAGKKPALGMKHTAEWCKNHSEDIKGRHIYNNGEVEIRCKENLGEGWVKGRLKRK